MKIAIDYTLATGHIGGMGVLVKNLSKYLKNLNSENKYVLVSNPNGFNKKNIYTKIASVFKQHLWYQIGILKDLKTLKADVLYLPNPPVPLLCSNRVVLTIPDMAFYYDKINPLIKTYLFIIYFLSAKKASKIITVSKYSKNDIIKILKVDTDKVAVIPLAIEDEFYDKKIKSDEIDKTLKKFHITKPYILCDPGSFVPRKNVKALIDAFSDLPPSRNLSLVLVGNNNDHDYKKMYNYVQNLEMVTKVVFTGYVSTVEKVHLYKRAKIHAYPSLYEGFGLPPLQAMAMGIPSIVFSKTSLPEVVGGAGIKVNNSKELTEAITKLTNNKKFYNGFMTKGLERAKKFSWQITANKFESTINSI